MILTFCGQNYTLLRVTAATPEEMEIIKATCTEKVDRFVARAKGHNGWDGSISLVWWVEPYFYVPAACWQRLWNLRNPDPQAYRPAYDVQFENQELFFNKTITLEEVQNFVENLNPSFDDVTDQVTVLYSIIRHRMSSHTIATGFGKTYLSYLLAQYAKQVLDGKTLLITPRVILVEQGVADFNDYMKTIEPERHLKLYGICGNFRNTCTFEEADVYIGTYQSLSLMPDDMFANVKAVICDEGHTSKAISVRDTVSKCKNTEIVTAISGTMGYMSGADALTVESVCGPLISSYPAWKQIEKGRLPKIAMQQIILRHTDGRELYDQMLQQERLPKPTGGIPPELAATYRRLEMKFLGNNIHMLNYILALCKQITDQNRNVLVIFKNRQPAINLFEYANEQGCKAHLILGGTQKDVRSGIKGQIEREGGWILSCTDGVMSMGVSINNLHGLILCMIGHSPHVTLQSVGRMLRNHPDKFQVTVCYDIVNDFTPIGSDYDLSNGADRLKLYKNENYPVYDRVIRDASKY
jgi:superfamily II DNA or RNA helicase